MHTHQRHSKTLSLGLLVVIITAMLTPSLAFAKSLVSVVDRTAIEVDESITLKVIYDASNVRGQPDFSSLQQNFDIVSNNTSSQRSNRNGVVTASTEWRMVLFPKKIGQLLIPPFSFNGVHTKPVTIAVTKNQSQGHTSNKPDIFIETDLSKTSIFVQEQTVLTYRLFFSRNVQSLDKADISTPNLRVMELPRADYQKRVGGKDYGVAEFRYALIPDASGAIDIPSQRWTIETTSQPSNRFGFNGGRRKLHRVKTDAIRIQVEPKPDSYPPTATWLPASRLTIAESWSSPPETFKVGEPITRTVTLHAEGLSSEQLPPVFSSPSTPDFKFYPDKPNQENFTTGSGLAGTRTESIAIVPNRGGELTLPKISITWWDTQTNTIQTASLPAITVTVAVSDVANNIPHTASPPHMHSEPLDVITVEKTSLLWVLVTCVSLLANILLMILAWGLYQKRQQVQQAQSQAHATASASTKKAFNDIIKYCKNEDANQLRKAILSWAAINWPNQQFTRLSDFSKVCQDQQLTKALTLLDSALFSECKSELNYPEIQEHLQKIPKPKNENSSKTQLQPLYEA